MVKKVVSDSNGGYSVLDVPIGSYNIKVSVKGFKSVEVDGVTIEVGGKPNIPLVMQFGQESEVVTVEADSVLIHTNSAELGSVVTSEQATGLQLNGRNYAELIALAPGVSKTVASAFSGLFGSYGASGYGQSINGMRIDNSNYFIDGVDNKDNGGAGNNFVNIGPDALEEFRTAASAYDASYGGSAGATISVAIKNGTRAFHGLAYEFIRNRAIQAYPFVPIGSVPYKSPFVYNDFGWTLGGPLFVPGHFNQNRDKLFFFAGQEFKRLRMHTNATLSVPTVAEKNGDLTALGGGVIPQCGGAVTTGCSTASGRALAQLFPNPNTGTNTFSFPSQAYFNSSEYLVKIDYNLNDKNQISGHFVHDYYTTPGTPTGLIVFDREVPGFTSSLQWTRTINARTANTLTGSYSGNRVIENTGVTSNPYFSNLPSITRTGNNLNYSTLFNASPDIPSVSVSGFSALSATALNFNGSARVYAVKDDFSHVIGNHSLKAGIYAWRNRKDQNSIPAINGSFGFTGSGATAFTNLLEGNFATYQEASAIQQAEARFSQIEGYVQDDWTVTRRLVVNLGFRYQYMEPMYSALYNGSAFYPSYFDPTHAATENSAGIITSNPYPYNGLVLGGDGFPPQAQGRVALANNPAVQALFHNFPAGLVNTYWNTPAPRVGFSYDLTGKQATVLHAGFGLSYDRLEGNYYINSVAQLPFVSLSSLTTGNVDTIASAAPAAANPSTISNSRVQNLANPRIKNWSLGIQQRISSDTMVEVNYVGTSSANLSYYQDLNQAAAGTVQAHPTITGANALRPYIGYADIFQSVNGGISNYHSLQAHLLKQMRRGGTISASYTWSKALTDAPYYNYNPQDSTNIRADYGPAVFNTPQIFVLSYVYPLPFWQHGNDWYKRAFGRFQVSGITRLSSGVPINVTQPSNTDVSGDAVTAVNERPNLVGNYFAGAKTQKQWISASAFGTPAPGTFGTFEAFGVPGPRYQNWDVSIQKTFPLYEQLGLDFRAELFNVANHLSAFSVNNTLGNSNFGQTSGATDPRTAEFAAKLHF